ncbi:DNA repair exonuclease, partial [Halobacteriales archaeon SW_7_68_16]
MTRVVHTGDTHLGYRQYNSPERRRDFAEAFERVIDDAIRDDADAVVHAGDLFHDRRPDLRDLQATVAALRELADADIPFLGVVGNHEGKRDGQWLDLLADLGLATRLNEEPTVIGDLALYGLDHVPPARREALEYEFEPTDADHTALVAHGLFEPFPHGDWDTDRLLAESPVEFDALLLGDDHRPDTRELDGTWLTYPGSTERASASEREDRGYNVVTTGDDDISIARRGLETRPFVFVDVTLSADEGDERVRQRVHEHDLDDAVVVVTVEGDGDPITPATIEEAATDDGALLARVNDRRDLADDPDTEERVTFADPDAAVRERLREAEFGRATLGIDETVRESKIADANVRETVEDRIR